MGRKKYDGPRPPGWNVEHKSFSEENSCAVFRCTHDEFEQLKKAIQPHIRNDGSTSTADLFAPFLQDPNWADMLSGGKLLREWPNGDLTDKELKTLVQGAQSAVRDGARKAVGKIIKDEQEEEGNDNDSEEVVSRKSTIVSARGKRGHRSQTPFTQPATGSSASHPQTIPTAAPAPPAPTKPAPSKAAQEGRYPWARVAADEIPWHQLVVWIEKEGNYTNFPFDSLVEDRSVPEAEVNHFHLNWERFVERLARVGYDESNDRIMSGKREIEDREDLITELEHLRRNKVITQMVLTIEAAHKRRRTEY